jgi:hypothetical protein
MSHQVEVLESLHHSNAGFIQLGRARIGNSQPSAPQRQGFGSTSSPFALGRSPA